MMWYSRRPQKAKRAVRCLAYTLTLAGCSGTSSSPDIGLVYAERVEEALKLPNGAVETLEVFPDRRDRRHDLEPIRVSFGEWNDLESCSAGGLIAAANSPLGRVRSPFERVRHSQSLLNALKDCENTMTERAWAEFQQARKQKADQIDEERWNAFWMSEPVQQSLGRTTPLEDALRSEAPSRWLELYSALEADTNGEVNVQAWYAAEALLDRTASVGEALRFMQQSTHALERVAKAVEQSRATRSNCLEMDRKAIALMRGHYAKKLQPLMAQGDQTLRTASEALAKIGERLTPSDGVPDGMAGWANQWADQAAFQRYRAAIRGHASQIGVLLKACKETL